MTPEDEYRAAEAHLEAWDGYVRPDDEPEPARAGLCGVIAALFGIVAFVAATLCTDAALWSAR